MHLRNAHCTLWHATLRCSIPVSVACHRATPPGAPQRRLLPPTSFLAFFFGPHSSGFRTHACSLGCTCAGYASVLCVCPLGCKRTALPCPAPSLVASGCLGLCVCRRHVRLSWQACYSKEQHHIGGMYRFQSMLLGSYVHPGPPVLHPLRRHSTHLTSAPLLLLPSHCFDPPQLCVGLAQPCCAAFAWPREA
jgi:hypothetical protein